MLEGISMKTAPRPVRHPILVGVGQIVHREKIARDAPTPSALAARAVQACVDDSGCTRILDHVDCLSVVNMFSQTENPVGPVCDLLGIKPGIREYTSIGGNTPQWLVNRAADKIVKGEINVALLAGAEALYSEDRAFDLWKSYKTLQEMIQRNELVGITRTGFSPHERLHNAYGAIRTYPMFENALRADRGLTIEEHRRFLSRHCAALSGVAGDNPLAWFRQRLSSDEIGKVSSRNRMISFPYTKRMNPVMAVNQAAAVLLTSTETARELSIPSEKWVYLLGGAEATEKWFLSDRIDYASSPAIQESARLSLEMAGLGIDQIDFFDLYSCFPSATAIAASALGLDIHDPLSLTLTGGLAYFGGPGNNYTMHAIAHAVQRIREKPEEVGLVTGVGLYLTKHSLGIYGGSEPEGPWNRDHLENIQEKIDGMESPELCLAPEGSATVETYTVTHDRDNAPDGSIIIARMDDGRRCFARTDPDPDLLTAMETEEFIGRKGQVRKGEDGPNIMSF
jgi:acetyl-CoA C-acetyltransferase